MTEQDINIKIAKYMGLKIADMFNGIMTVHEPKDIRSLVEMPSHINDNGIVSKRYKLPDYCRDLNAVWEVEEKMMQEDLIDDYTYNLHDANIKKYPLTTRSFTGMLSHARHIPAKQCCEAIIKVVEGLK